MSLRLKRIPDESEIAIEGASASAAPPRTLLTLQLGGLLVTFLGFGARFLLDSVFENTAVFALLGAAGWAFFGGATAASNRVTQVMLTFLAVGLCAGLFALLPEHIEIAASIGIGYFAGLISGIVVLRQSRP